MTCIAPSATTSHAVTVRGSDGNITRANGTRVSSTETRNPTRYERLLPWLVPALL